jgi:elongation factor Tu
VLERMADGPGRGKPRLTIGTIGQAGHGKTTLLTAIATVLSDASGGFWAGWPFLEDRRVTARESASTAVATYIGYETPDRAYSQVDWSGRPADVAGMILAAGPMDAAILVVSAADGPTPQTREQLLLTRQAGVRSIVVFLNKVDLFDDEELVELVEVELRELLSEYGYDGDDVPVVAGSARRALEGDPAHVASVRELISQLDRDVPDRGADLDEPFLLSVTAVMPVPEGVRVTGHIDRGFVRPGDVVEIIGPEQTATSIVDRVSVAGTAERLGRAGDVVSVLMGEVAMPTWRWQVLCTPGSIAMHARFTAEIYVLSREEGGRGTPLRSGSYAHFVIRTIAVEGDAILLGDVELVWPGDRALVDVTLVEPAAVEVGTRFAIRDGGRTVALGVVAGLPTRRAAMPRADAVAVGEYKSSGGRSRIYELPGDQVLVIEPHEDSFSVLWSTNLSVTRWLKQISPLLPSDDATAFVVGAPEHRMVQLPLTELSWRITESAAIEFVRVQYRDRALTWEAPQGAVGDEQPATWGEAALMAGTVNRAYVADCVRATATPLVQEVAELLIANSLELLKAFVIEGEL